VRPVDVAVPRAGNRSRLAQFEQGQVAMVSDEPPSRRSHSEAYYSVSARVVGGNAVSLVEKLDGVKAYLEGNPAAARHMPAADSELVGPYEVRARTGAHDIVIDEPSGIGGGDTGPNPVEVALAALGSCQAITYRMWALRLGIQCDEVKVRVEGDIDARGLLGIEGSARPGLTAVRVAVVLEGPDRTRFEELRTAVDQHCPVLDIFAIGVPVTTTLSD
jgi:putative redox protein